VRRQIEALEALLRRPSEPNTGTPQEPEGSGHTPAPANLVAGAHVPLSAEKAKAYSKLLKLEDAIRQADPDFYTLAKPLSVADMAHLADRLQRTLITIWVGTSQRFAFFVEPSGAFGHLSLPDVTQATLRSWLFGTAGHASLGGWIGTYLQFREGLIGRGEWIEQMSSTLADVHERMLKPIRGWLNRRQANRQPPAVHEDICERPAHLHRIAFVGAGALSLLPLHAAAEHLPNGEVHYSVEELDLVYAPSASVLERRRFCRNDRLHTIPKIQTREIASKHPSPARRAVRHRRSSLESFPAHRDI
jgi:hypothetical protein